MSWLCIKFPGASSWKEGSALDTAQQLPPCSVPASLGVATGRTCASAATSWCNISRSCELLQHMPPTAEPDGPGIVPAGVQPRLPLDQDPKSQVPPTIHPYGPTETQCLFFCGFPKGIILVHHGSRGLARICPLLLQPGLEGPSLLPQAPRALLWKQPDQLQRLLPLEWGRCAEAWPQLSALVLTPSQQSWASPFSIYTSFFPFATFYIMRSWGQALPLSIFTSNIPESSGSVLHPMITSVTSQMLSRWKPIEEESGQPWHTPKSWASATAGTRC